jgi:CheY-like chemotaxis protein
MSLKLLLVDDERATLGPIAQTLESTAFDVVFVRSSKAAIKLVETRQYHVVCMDFGANGEGLEFLARAAQAAPGVGLLLLASSDELRAVKEARDVRDTGVRRTPSSDRVPGLRVLIKPFDTEQLVTTVAHVARMADMRRSTHAMASAVSPGREEDRVSDPGEPPPRSLFPRKV